MNTHNIQTAVNQFVTFVKLGWKTELAFECAYDQVYDEIGEEAFLNLCQAEIKKHA
jgi:uncharacterized protein with von Willebrand factor type A (vWA) domain